MGPDQKKCDSVANYICQLFESQIGYFLKTHAIDFIHYNPSEKPLLAYDDSSDDIDFDVLAIQYG